MEIIEKGDKRYPKRLLEVIKPPKRLYVEGNLELLNKDSLAIVGSRKCTEYGIKHAKEFAKKISQKDIAIISGFATGIDTVAHEVASKYEGNTIAVMGAGFNNIYPEENKELLKQILKNGGLIISEYPPETEVDMKNFPKRNRIISALAKGVLVIEAAHRSGSTITARYALKQDKTVFCLPRNIGEPKGVGTNELIKQGAILVTSPNDILREFRVISGKERFNIVKEEQESNINKEYLDIYNFITYIPINIEILAKKTGISISEINQKLTMMELEGYIKSMPGNNYVRL